LPNSAVCCHTRLEGVVYTVAEHIASRMQHAAEIVRITRQFNLSVCQFCGDS